jgi:hypothetical protein
MNARWLSDARKIPDEVMNYLRRLAVRAVRSRGTARNGSPRCSGSAGAVFMSGCGAIGRTARRRWTPEPRPARRG